MVKRNESFPQQGLTRRNFLKLAGLGMFGIIKESTNLHQLPRIGAAESANLHKSAPIAIGGAARRLTGLSDARLALSSSQAWLRSSASWQALGEPQDETPQQGRVQDAYVSLMEEPSFDAKRVKFIWKDSVIPIQSAIYREDTDSHNRVWYQVGNEGYVHSGAVQPVRTQLNEIVTGLPETGVLAEVTVPYTDAHWNPGQDDYVAYRFYYATTHWISYVKYDNQGQAWYAVLDDKWEYIYYVQASHMRVLPQEELIPLSQEMPAGFKRLEVHIPEQVLIAYELDEPVFMARVASGAKFRDGDFSTQPGRYMTFHKRPTRHMAAGNLAANGYDLPGVPWICYFTESGISFHGTYWHNNFGRPRSHGCVNLTPQAAKWIYRWTIPVVPPGEIMTYERYGTPINVIDQETYWQG